MLSKKYHSTILIGPQKFFFHFLSCHVTEEILIYCALLQQETWDQNIRVKILKSDQLFRQLVKEIKNNKPY